MGIATKPLLLLWLLLLLGDHLLLHAAHASSHASHHTSTRRAPRGRPGLLTAIHPCIGAIPLPCSGTVAWGCIRAIALSWVCGVSLCTAIDVGIRRRSEHRRWGPRRLLLVRRWGPLARSNARLH